MRPRRSRSKRSRSASITFDAHSFEYLRTGESDVLLRLEGTWAAGSDRAVPGIELRLSYGEDWTALEPLPDPSNFPVAATPKGVAWRAAFPAFLEEVEDRDSRFVLCLGDGTMFDLPAPLDRDAVPAEPEPDPEPEPEPQADTRPAPAAGLPEAERIKAIIAESIQRFGVLEARIEEERAAREDIERRLARAEAEREQAVNSLGSAANVRTHLETAVEQAEAARKQAEGARDEALANVASIESQLESTTRELEQAWADTDKRDGAAGGELETLHAELEAARAEAAKLKSVVDLAVAARKAAEKQLAGRDGGETELREQLERAERDVTTLRAEAEGKAERIEQLESAVEDAGAYEKRVIVLEDQLADAQRVAARVEELEAAISAGGDHTAARVSELEAELAAAQAAAKEFERRFEEVDRASEEFARRAREAEEGAEESAGALEAAVGERGRAESRVAELEAALAEAQQLANADAMAREDLQRKLESGEGSTDEDLKRELEKAREAAVRERGQRASFEKELKRRDDAEFELGKKVERLESELESARSELASRNEAISEWQRRVEDTRNALEAAEAAASEARIARAHLERDLRELGESGDGDGDPETALARHKSEMAGLRRDLEESEQREREATGRIAELERGLAEAGEDAQKQQAIGEIERLRAALGQATALAQEEAKRRSELEDELESRVVAEERLRAMLQAKGAPPRTSDDADSAPVGIEALEVGGAAATTQGDFLERLAAANKQAEAVER